MLSMAAGKKNPGVGYLTHHQGIEPESLWQAEALSAGSVRAAAWPHHFTGSGLDKSTLTALT